MIAIVSDIHSNLQALEAVLSHSEALRVSEAICLGDVVGYGPQPQECLRVARERFSLTLCGNHEWAIVNDAVGFRQVAREAVEWHRRVLTPRWYSPPGRRLDWEFMKDLPRKHVRGRFLFVHASPTNPTEEYLLPSDIDELTGEASPKLLKAFELTDWITFCGHTHHPGLFTFEPPEFRTPSDLEDSSYHLEPGRKAIINVGSVGQPRDGDRRACYVTLHEGVVTYHRVPYDAESACHRVIETGALHESLGRRLLDGT